mmetsp:Transcript_20322/g.48412  ORF Transcript_20322/g.48412 Transcript_20322/m.48412 type:complete len:108 (+) Transcript_20322:130-453(+)
MRVSRFPVSRFTSLVGSTVQVPWRGSARCMSSGHSVEQEIAECNKWRTVSLIAAPACLALSAYFMAQPHEHFEEPPEYSYLRVRNKEFPWGDCALFDTKCWKAKTEE